MKALHCMDVLLLKVFPESSPWEAQLLINIPNVNILSSERSSLCCYISHHADLVIMNLKLSWRNFMLAQSGA